MLNVLKNAAYYTAIYFLTFTVVLWSTLFIMIVAQVFWKAFALIFLFLICLFTFDYIKLRGGLKAIFTNWTMPVNQTIVPAS